MSFPVPEGMVWMNGTLVPCERAVVSLRDPGLQSGLGVFETVALREGVPLELEEHLARLAEGARALGVPLPEAGLLAPAAAAIAASVAGGYGWLKVLATRGGDCFVYGGPMDPSEEGRAVSAVLLGWRRGPRDPLVGVKSLSYAERLLGLEEAGRRGADEGVWLNMRGHLTEACTSNLFLVSRKKVFTPAVREGVLPGVVRGLAVQAARGLGLVLHETKVRLERLERAQEAFLTSSLKGVRPLVRFEGRPVGKGVPGPVTLSIADEVRKLRRPMAVRSGTS